MRKTMSNEATLDILNLPDEELVNISLEDYEKKILEQEGIESGEQPEEPEEEEQVEQEEENPVQEPQEEELEPQEGTYEGVEEKVAEKASEEPSTQSNTQALPEDAFRIFQSFRANGKDIQVNSTDDVIQLMQMGANYYKKMEALKPRMKILHLLEQEKLLDMEKLSYLIALNKGDKDAIAKLVTDNEFDSYEIDTDKVASYKPHVRHIADNEWQLQETLEAIKESPAYERTIKIAGVLWDEPSRKILVDDPSNLQKLNEHVEIGLYDFVWAQVERERMFGRLTNVSDLAAYKQVADMLNENGQLAQFFDSQVVQPKPQQTKPANKEKRKAAAPSNSGTNDVTSNDVNYLAMSDEDFQKLAGINL